MADFDPSFASDGERRLATALERELGFGCGPADQSLFNGLFWQLQSELAAIHAEAGITPDDSTTTTTLDAILALISSATGGNPAGYILMTQARARLPIFPDVGTTDGRVIVTSPSPGTVRIPGGVDFLHRGIFAVTTAQTDFATTASKIYHLRWNPTDSFALIETGDGTYNPSALAETSTAFDSTYDSMFIARVVTNSSNVATITNLANKSQLRMALNETMAATLATENSWAALFTVPINWGRTPIFTATNSNVYAGQPGTAKVQGGANRISDETVDRYALSHRVFTDWDSTPAGFSVVNAALRGGLIA